MTLLNIYYLVQEFYAIEAISAMLSGTQGNNFEPMRHSHSRWYMDFNVFRNKYIIKFASVIYDYTVLVVAAELRHCRDKASQYIKGYYNSWDQSRDGVYVECSIFNANEILMAGMRMFDTGLVNWRGGYGGDKWKQIAKAGLMKGKVSDCVFIDHCVDLSHNNSIYFDKSAGIFYLQDRKVYQSFLDLKQSCEPQLLINKKQGYTFNRLLWRAKNLNIIEGQQLDGLFSPSHDETADLLFYPHPVNRAEKLNNVELQQTDGFFSNCRDEAELLLFQYQPIDWGDRRLDYSESNIVTRSNLNYRMRRKCDREYDRENNRNYDKAA